MFAEEVHKGRDDRQNRGNFTGFIYGKVVLKI